MATGAAMLAAWPLAKAAVAGPIGTLSRGSDTVGLAFDPARRVLFRAGISRVRRSADDGHHWADLELPVTETAAAVRRLGRIPTAHHGDGSSSLAGAGDMLQLVMGVLLSSVTGYVMAAYHRDSALSLEAGMKYFLIGACTNTLLMIGVALLFGVLGQTTYVAMAAALTAHSSSAPCCSA